MNLRRRRQNKQFAPSRFSPDFADSATSDLKQKNMSAFLSIVVHRLES